MAIFNTRGRLCKITCNFKYAWCFVRALRGQLAETCYPDPQSDRKPPSLNSFCLRVSLLMRGKRPLTGPGWIHFCHFLIYSTKMCTSRVVLEAIWCCRIGSIFFLPKCFLGERKLQGPCTTWAGLESEDKFFFLIISPSGHFTSLQILDLSFSTVDCYVCIILITTRTGGPWFCRSNQQEPQTNKW